MKLKESSPKRIEADPSSNHIDGHTGEKRKKKKKTKEAVEDRHDQEDCLEQTAADTKATILPSKGKKMRKLRVLGVNGERPCLEQATPLEQGHPPSELPKNIKKTVELVQVDPAAEQMENSQTKKMMKKKKRKIEAAHPAEVNGLGEHGGKKKKKSCLPVALSGLHLHATSPGTSQYQCGAGTGDPFGTEVGTGDPFGTDVGTRACTRDLVSAIAGTRACTSDLVSAIAGTRACTSDLVSAIAGTRACTSDLVSAIAGTRACTSDLVSAIAGTRACTSDLVSAIAGTRACTSDLLPVALSGLPLHATSPGTSQYQCGAGTGDPFGTEVGTGDPFGTEVGTRACTSDLVSAIAGTRACTSDLLPVALSGLHLHATSPGTSQYQCGAGTGDPFGTEVGTGDPFGTEEMTSKKRLQKTKASTETEFVRFENSSFPVPLFFKHAKGGKPRAAKQGLQTPESGSKKVTFGLNNNKTADGMTS
ncbi:UNVERIFIED_CONTAM: hypothetical protein FKN15_020039 [Acipenser sinensis]